MADQPSIAQHLNADAHLSKQLEKWAADRHEVALRLRCVDFAIRQSCGQSFSISDVLRNANALFLYVAGDEDGLNAELSA